MNNDQELLKLSPGQLVDLGICPTCFNRSHGGVLYGDTHETLLYADCDIECFLVKNPRARGHMCISTVQHYHDMSEAPDALNEKVIRFSKAFMIFLKEVYQCERVYLCTMCDGPNNHYHVQLIPRYAFEKRGSSNFVKQRTNYIFEPELFAVLKEKIKTYANHHP